MSGKFSVVGLLLVGIVLGGAGSWWLLPTEVQGESASDVDSNQPLYWVAPMDANYRRDKPGKSPMGMDLVPVYAEGANTKPEAGVVRISPDVVNNLGVRTAPVVMGDLSLEVNTVGYVQYDQDQLLHLHPRVEGWVEKLNIQAAGDPVVKGQLLYQLYSPELVNAQQELLIALNRGNRDLIESARRRLLALDVSTAFVKRVEQTNEVVQSVPFYAPRSGVVENLNIRQGFYVKPGTALLSIAQLDQVWVEAEVFERDVLLVREGAKVSMTLDYLPGQQWQGEVDYIYPTLDANTRTLGVRLKFANPGYQLKPNMFSRIRIDTPVLQDVLLVPAEGVIRTGEQNRVVLALGQGRYKSVAVTTGMSNGELVQVTSGVEVGDKLVTSAQFLLDSESSKHSDFRRYSHGSSNAEMAYMAEDEHSGTWTTGVINHISRDTRQLNILHDPIKKWGRPSMVMTFEVTPELDIASLTEGELVRFYFVAGDEFVITQFGSEEEGHQ